MIEDGLTRLADAVANNRNINPESARSIEGLINGGRKVILEAFDDADSKETEEQLAILDKAIYSAQNTMINGTPEEVLGLLLEIFKQAATALDTALRDSKDELEISRRAREYSREKILHAIAGIDMLATRSEFSKTAQEVRRIAGDIREAAGDVANSELAAHYQEGATIEGRRYLYWNILFGSSILASVALVSFLLSRSSHTDWSVQEATRITLAIPLLAFALHAARQSRFHRDTQASLGLVAVKLKTVRAFTDSLEPHNRQELFKMLGENIFGAPSQSNQQDHTEPSLNIADVTDLIRSRGTGENDNVTPKG
jgi:hypothetical protein